MTTIVDQANKVEAQSTDAMRLNRHSSMLTALLGGTETMRQAGERFLPRMEAEEQKAYDRRVAVATLFPAYQRTVEVLASRPFSKPVVLSQDTPAVVREDWSKDIDKQGASLADFANRCLVQALGHGFGGILVDAPDATGKTQRADGQLSLDDEKKLGIRPYWVMIRGDDILGWRYAVENGEFKLKQLRIMECVQEDDGKFGVKDVKQIRVLEPGKWELYRQTERADKTGFDWTSYKSGTTALDYIPFVPVYGLYKGPMRAEPPLLNLAYMNIEHWQSKSDQDNILHIARVPILSLIGGDEKSKLVIGGSSAVIVPIGGKLEFVEHNGNSIKAGSDSLKMLEDLMRQAGAELLVIRPGDITATQIFSENEAGMCTLQRITLNLQVSLNLALKYTADFAKEAKPGEVTLFTNFGVASLNAATGDLLLKLNQGGKISDETHFKEQQRIGTISADIDWEEEQTRIEESAPVLGTMGVDDEVEIGPDGKPVIDEATGAPKLKKKPTGAPPPFGGKPGGGGAPQQ